MKYLGTILLTFDWGGGVPAIRDFISQVVKSCKRGMNPFRSLFQASQEQFSVPPSFLLDGFLSLDGRCALTFAGLRDCAIITWREGWEMGKIRLKIKSHPPPLTRRKLTLTSPHLLIILRSPPPHPLPPPRIGSLIPNLRVRSFGTIPE